MTINERVRAIRKDQGMTQEEFAKELNIAGSAVSMMEREGGGVSKRNISIIVDKMGISEEWLNNGTGDMYSALITDKQIASILGDVLRDGSDFKRRFIAVLSRMSPEEWILLEQRIKEIAKE